MTREQTIAKLRLKASYHRPLTMGEQRWLIEEVSGEPLPPSLKRCERCDGNGELAGHSCSPCRGTGYK